MNENEYQRLKRLYQKTLSDLNTMIRRYKRLEKDYKKLKNENAKLKSKLRKNKGL